MNDFCLKQGQGLKPVALPCMAYTGVCRWTGVFVLSVLNRVYNFAQVCPKQVCMIRASLF